MKPNANGVMPLIFALTIMQFPMMIIQIADPNYRAGHYVGFTGFYLQYLRQGTLVYTLIYALLIVAFAYFYTTISFNPIEMSKNLQQNGGFIPGIRPGKPTSDYIMKVLNRVTWFGAFFLAIITILPSLLELLTNIKNMWFGGTSLIIMVGVALDTVQQLESQLMMRHYKGFLD
jgi:preprotein translocase subunit SecY